jgi:N-acetylmuramoyl-L-alanine amidase
MIKRAFLDSYKSCIMITAYMLVAIIIVLSSDNLYGKGNRVVEAYAKVDSNINTFSPVEEETANEAQIQADELDLNVQLDKLMQDNSTGLFNAVIANGSTLAYKTGIATVRENMKDDMLEETQKIIQAENEAKAKALKELQKQEKEKEEAIQKAKEEKAKKEQAKAEALSRNSKSSVIQLSTSEKEILQRIVEAEATGEDIKGKMLVANVILNRVANDRFPDTVEKVVFQRNGNTVQFSPIKDGRYWSVTVSRETREAVARVLAGEDESQGALFFSARSRADASSMSWFDRNLKWLFKYGGHEFYRFK